MGALFSLNHVGAQVVAMTATFILCLTLGAERHVRHKDAGVKTHVLVGLGSCLFTLVSAYGFAPVTGADVVNNDTVRGLTTAATVWLSAAIGMACGAGMIPLAATAVALDYVVVLLLGPLTSRLQRRRGEVTVRIDYQVGRAIMPEILQAATASGFTATLEETEMTRGEHGRIMNAVMRFHGKRPTAHLIEALSGLDGVDGVECLEGGRLD